MNLLSVIGSKHKNVRPFQPENIKIVYKTSSCSSGYSKYSSELIYYINFFNIRGYPLDKSKTFLIDYDFQEADWIWRYKGGGFDINVLLPKILSKWEFPAMMQDSIVSLTTETVHQWILVRFNYIWRSLDWSRWISLMTYSIPRLMTYVFFPTGPSKLISYSFLLKMNLTNQIIPGCNTVNKWTWCTRVEVNYGNNGVSHSNCFLFWKVLG